MSLWLLFSTVLVKNREQVLFGMHHRNLVLVTVTFLLVTGTASISASSEPSMEDAVVPPPDTDMEIGQNGSHVAWDYRHRGGLVNFTAGDEIQVFPSDDPGNSSGPSDEPDDSNRSEPDPGDDGGGDDNADSVTGDEGSPEDTESPEDDGKSDDSSDDSDEEGGENGGGDLLPDIFPEAAEDGGFLQNITDQFTRSSSVLTAVFLAFSGLGAYIYRF